MNRGDVLLVRFPHPSGGRGKNRPVVVVQADAYNQTLRTLVMAEVTTNLGLAIDPACLFIDAVLTPLRHGCRPGHRRLTEEVKSWLGGVLPILSWTSGCAF